MGSYISVFSLSRAIRLAKRIDRSILKSIVTPSAGLPRQSQLINDIVALSKDLILRYCPSFLSTPGGTLGANLESETFVEAVKGFLYGPPLSDTLMTKRMKRYLHGLQRPLRVPSTLFRV
ncbi:hypothetical protein VNO77_47139 [Canavalia gladiata]|uniref:EAL domain-containing protein n=1 Tax=Canavalia gladiata TaxID=3824 RepID=A0AAN9JFL2_CANGL